MTQLQFIVLLTPAVGSVVLVLLVWLHQNQWLTDTNNRFDGLKADMNQQFDRMDRQFDRTDRRLILIENDQKQFFTVTGKMDGRIDELSRK